MPTMRSARCVYCGDAFERPANGKDAMRFCSSSHSAKYNNALRRSPDGIPESARCGQCRGRRSNSRKDGVCQTCRKANDLARISALTLAELREELSTLSFHAKVRGWSRAAYQGLACCEACGYNLHVDICHVRDVSSFPTTATIGEVNNPSNLVALCKNHHWEFDNGHLTVRGVCKTTKGQAQRA